MRFTERLAFVRLDEAEKALEATETLIKNIESSLVNAYVKLSKQVANFDTKYKEHWIQVVAAAYDEDQLEFTQAIYFESALEFVKSKRAKYIVVTTKTGVRYRLSILEINLQLKILRCITKTLLKVGGPSVGKVTN